MDAGPHEPRSTVALRLVGRLSASSADPVAPRARVPLLVLGFIALAAGLAGGLVRAGVLSGGAPAAGIAWHGALMVSAFFGTVISLERAVALGRLWGYAAPLACGLGGVLLIAGATAAGLWLMAAGAAALVAASAAVWARQPGFEVGVLLAATLCGLTGTGLVAAGGVPAAALPWWIAFFVLTIGGERLELSRYVPRGPGAKALFALIAAALVLAALAGHWAPEAGRRALGAALVALALWLAVHDIARQTVRQRGLTRYIAHCLLAGYVWLAFGGAATLVTGAVQDAALHALMLGFVFSMVFGHAPVILPAVLRVAVPYAPWLYLPLVLLHATLALRVAGTVLDAPALYAAGAAGNAVALAAFILTTATLVLRGRPPRSAVHREAA